MHKLHALFRRSSANLRVTVTWQRVSSVPLNGSPTGFTEVGDTNPTGKVEHLPPVVEMNIRALTLGHDRLRETSKTLGNMLLAELR